MNKFNALPDNLKNLPAMASWLEGQTRSVPFGGGEILCRVEKVVFTFGSLRVYVGYVKPPDVDDSEIMERIITNYRRHLTSFVLPMFNIKYPDSYVYVALTRMG